MVHSDAACAGRLKRPVRAALLFLLLMITAFCAGAQDGPFEIDLGLAMGIEPVVALAGSGLATEEITPGILLENLVRRIYIYRRIHERLLLDFDYDAARSGETLFGEQNYYGLVYTGGEGEFVQSASLGNRTVTIPGDYYIRPESTSGSSVALTGEARTPAGSGELVLRGIARMGSVEHVTLTYAGSRRLVELTATDTGHARRKHFFLPDSEIDPGSLELFVSSGTGADLVLDGQTFSRLLAPGDFSFDPTRSWIHLRTAVASADLVVTYTVADARVGDAGLGVSAFIREDGIREDFSTATHASQFGEADGVRYLYLNRSGSNSYWEHRGVYEFAELREADLAGTVQVEVLLTDSFRPNANYSSVVGSYIISTDLGALVFEPEDVVGFYPRPFPGLYPFTHPVTPGNPFEAGNPIYGDINASGDGESMNTLRLRFPVEAEAYVIADLFVQGSVRVRVSGRELDSSEFRADEATGVVSIADGLVGPDSAVEIEYARAAEADASQRLLAAASMDWSSGTPVSVYAHTMVAFEIPVGLTGYPAPGGEEAISITASGDLRASRSWVGGTSVEGVVRGAATIARPNAQGEAVIASMDDGSSRVTGLDAADWILASASTLLPGASTPVVPAIRGELSFEDYYDDSFIGGGLRTLSWDNSENLSFSYSGKAGPYNTADGAPDGESFSLVLDYRFDAGETDQFAGIVREMSSGLDEYDSLAFTWRGDGITGETVRLYVEVLQVYNEDLDDDGELDGESSVDQPGFAITPAGGGPTIIGANRSGLANGILDSEDLNGNGRLDTTASESGALVATAADDYVLEVVPGDTNWTTTRVDLSSLVAASPAAFEDAQALRLTLIPAAVPSVESTGRLVINDLSFESSGLTPDPSGGLQTRTVVSDWGDEEGKAVELTLLPPLSDGERTFVSRDLGGARDLTAYETVVINVRVPDPAALPAGLLLDVRLVSVPGDYHYASIAPSALDAGWNEIAITTGEDPAVTVNGVAVTTLAKEGDHASLASVASVELGLTASGADVTEAVTIVTDEWRVVGSRYAAGVAGGISVEASHAGGLLPVSGRHLVTDPRVAVSYDYDNRPVTASGTIAAAGGNVHQLLAEGSLTVGGLLPLSVSAGWVAEEVPAEGNTLTITTDVGLAADAWWIPDLEHSYRYLSDRDVGLLFTDLSYQSVERTGTEATVRLGEVASFPWGWSQEMEASRTVSGSRGGEPGGTTILEDPAATLTDMISGFISSGATPWSLRVSGEASRTATGTEASLLEGPTAAYLGMLSGLAVAPADLLAAGRLESKRLSAAFDLTPPPDAEFGAILEVDSSVNEARFVAGDASRTISASGSVLVGTPVAFGSEARVTVRPSLFRSFSASVDSAAPDYSKWWALGQAWLPTFSLPFADRTVERDAVQAAVDGLRVAGAATAGLTTRAETEIRVAASPWYLPSPMVFAVEGTTGVGPSGVSQTRLVSGRFSNSVPVVQAGRGAGTLVYGSSGSWECDHLSDTDTIRVSGTVYYAFASISGKDWSVSHNSSWIGARQQIALDRMLIYPDDPAREPSAAVTDASDTLVSRSVFTYRWRADRVPTGRSSTLALRLGLGDEPQQVLNTEEVSIDTSVTMTDPVALGTTVQLPFRLTLSHSSEITRSENLSFLLSARAQGGVEKHVSGGYVDLVPALGLEVEIVGSVSY